jgi:hypothetical protein
MTPEEALRRANSAERIFNDPFVQETLDFMEKEVMEVWMSCPVRDVEGRESAWRLAVTTRKFRDLLRGTMESGKIASEQIRQKQESLAARAATAVRNFRR